MLRSSNIDEPLPSLPQCQCWHSFLPSNTTFSCPFHSVLGNIQQECTQTVTRKGGGGAHFREKIVEVPETSWAFGIYNSPFFGLNKSTGEISLVTLPHCMAKTFECRNLPQCDAPGPISRFVVLFSRYGQSVQTVTRNITGALHASLT